MSDDRDLWEAVERGQNLVDGIGMEREMRKDAEARVRVLSEALRRAHEYILFTVCPACGLPDPTRKAADCDQCALAREALAGGGQPDTGQATDGDELVLVTRDEGDRIDEQMYRAGGAPDERELLGEAFDAENGAGASDELRHLAAENTAQGLPCCPFCGGELCAVVLEGDVPGVSCGGCGAYTSRLPWREPWLYEGRTS